MTGLFSYKKIEKERRVMPKQKRLTDKEKAEVITDNFG